MASIIEKTWRATKKDPKTGEEREVSHKGYQVQIRLKGFPSVTETFERKTDAKAWAQKIEADMKAGRYFPERKKLTKTLAELVDRYVADVAPSKKNCPEIIRQLAWWKAEHGHLVLANLTTESLADIRDELARKPTGRGKSGSLISGSTVNRYMGVLSQALTMASREWGWMRDNPIRNVTKKKETRGRVRMLTDSERDKLLVACRASGAWYLEPCVILALSTGMRRGEILGLRWPDIDLGRARLTLDDTKNSERRGVPLAGPALAVLTALAKVRVIDNDRVFHGTGSFEHAWQRAVSKAKILDFRFHDLRHTAASYLAMKGASPSEIAAVLGHKTLAMVKRYAHLHDEHIAGVVSRMVAANLGGVTYSGPTPKGAPKPSPLAAVVPLPVRRKKAT